MGRNLAKDVKLLAAGAAITAASNINSLGNAIDMTGFEGVMFIAPIEDCVATGVATVQVEQCDTSGGSYEALAGDDVVLTSVADDDLNQKYVVIDIYKPRKQWVKLRRKSATANIAYASAIAVLYGAQSRPTALGAIATAARNLLVSPAAS